jgi:hypothetical protein
MRKMTNAGPADADDLDRLCTELEAEDWLAGFVNGSVDLPGLPPAEPDRARIVRLGRLLRYLPPAGSRRARAAEERLRAVVRALPPKMVQKVERAASEDAAYPLRMIEAAMGPGRAGRPPEIQALRLARAARDDLQSVARVLHLRREGAELDRRLTALDKAAQRALGIDPLEQSWSFHDASPDADGDPRWDALAWMEPEAWWGALP